MKYTSPFDGKEETKMSFENLEEMYINSLNVNNNKHDCKFVLNDKLRKINYRRTKDQKLNKTQMFTVHSTFIERSLFNRKWEGRTISTWPYTVPNNSSYIQK